MLHWKVTSTWSLDKRLFIQRIRHGQCFSSGHFSGQKVFSKDCTEPLSTRWQNHSTRKITSFHFITLPFQVLNVLFFVKGFSSKDHDSTCEWFFIYKERFTINFWWNAELIFTFPKCSKMCSFFYFYIRKLAFCS